MSTFAQVYNGRAHNVVLGADLYSALSNTFHPNFIAHELAAGRDWTDVPEGTLHNATDNGDGTFTNPPEVSPVKSWDVFDFKAKFTVAERIAIRTAAKSDASVEDFLDMLDTAGMTGTMIKASDPLLNAALDTMTLGGLIGPGRKSEILT